MDQSSPTLETFLEHGYDALIDVRSPLEFEEDHVPGAINLPVLDDDERARVGTLYKQASAFEARKLGAALVFRNAARHIDGALRDKDGAWRPLIYCWRGGQRSGSFAWMLRQIGWRAETVPGGYRTFRRLVSAVLYETELDLRLVLLDGFTGTAKTELLSLLHHRGLQVLDLEALARHRGSLLGDLPGGQPSQKAFETALVHALNNFDASAPVIVEAESSKIGARSLPPALWAAMKRAPRILIEAPLEARSHYLARAYANVLSDRDRLCQRLDALRRFRGHALVDQWHALASRGDHVALCRSLVQDHYDPAYAKSRRAHPERTTIAVLRTDGLCDAALVRLAGELERALRSNPAVPGHR